MWFPYDDDDDSSLRFRFVVNETRHGDVSAVA